MTISANYQFNRICLLNLFTLLKQCFMNYKNKVIDFEGFYRFFFGPFGRELKMKTLQSRLRCSNSQKLGATKSLNLLAIYLVF